MATYQELLTAAQSDDLKKKVRVACMIAANAIMTENTATPNHAGRLAWARSVYENPEAIGKKMLWAVIAQNNAVALSAITGASDANVQTAVNAAVDLFAG